MYSIGGYESIIYFLSFFSLILFASLSIKHSKKEFRKRVVLIKRICLGVFIITSAYWYVTFPHVNYLNSPDESEYAAVNLQDSQEAVYITEHHKRIYRLESELKDTREDLEMVSGRLSLFLNLFTFGLIYFGVRWIFTSNRENTKETPDNLSSEL